MAADEGDSKIITGPVLGRPEDFPESPRRERGPGRVLAYAVIGVIVVLMTVGWGFVVMLGRGAPDVRGQVISFDVTGPDAISITFQVRKPADRTAACRLRAVDVNGAEVASREVEITSGDESVTLTERLQTSGRAWNGQVQHCYLVQ
jgi:hypothetical protein